MPTKADLFNRAIGYVGEVTQDLIEDPDDPTSANARRCSRFYESSLEAFLNEFHWSWARKYVALNQTATTPEQNAVSWRFVYFWPIDCVEPRWLTVASSTSSGSFFSNEDRVPYEVAIDVNNQQVIYTNLEDAVLRYTARVENFNQWPGSAFRALAMTLAVDMAPSFTGGRKVIELQVLLERMMDVAKQASATMENPEIRESTEFQDARHGSGRNQRHPHRHL